MFKFSMMIFETTRFPCLLFMLKCIAELTNKITTNTYETFGDKNYLYEIQRQIKKKSF